MCQEVAGCLSGGQGAPSEPELPQDLWDQHGAHCISPPVMRMGCGKGAETGSKEFIFPGWHLPPAMASPSLAQHQCLSYGPAGAGINFHGSRCMVRKGAVLPKESCYSVCHGTQVIAPDQPSCGHFCMGFCILLSTGAFSLARMSPLQHGSCKTSSGDTCAASGAGLGHVSACKTQVSTRVWLRNLSWPGHPSLRLRHVIDAGWSSTSKAPDVSSAEHHRLHRSAGTCAAASRAPEVGNIQTCGMRDKQGAALCPWPVEKDASQTKLLVSFWSSHHGSAETGVSQPKHWCLLDLFLSRTNPGDPAQLSWDFSMVSSLMCDYKSIMYLCECCHA